MTTHKENLLSENSTQQQKARNRDLLKYMSLFGGVQGLNMLIALVRNKITAVLLGTAGVGVLALFNAALGLINQISNLGVPFSAVRNLSALSQEENPQKMQAYVRVVRCWSLLVATLGFVTCFLLAPQLSQWSFGSADYVVEFRWLSFAVALTTLAACELALLKAVRNMKQVIQISWMSTLGSLAIVAPLYGWYGQRGIPLVLFFISVWIASITYAHSLKVFPLKGKILTSLNLCKGKSLFQLGASFVLAGIFGSATDYLLRAYLMEQATLDTVALYNAANAILITYLGSVFVAIDNDYFPKLSALNRQPHERELLVNGQIEIALLLVTPLLTGMLIFLPWVIPLLYTADFLGAAVIVQFGIFYLFFKALTLPMAYMALAHSDSKWYLVLEGGYGICFLLMMMGTFQLDSLRGLGIGMSLIGLLDFLVLKSFTRWRYGLILSKATLKTLFSLLFFLVITFFWSFQQPTWTYWIGGSILVLLSGGLSVWMLIRKTDFLTALRRKWNR